MKRRVFTPAPEIDRGRVLLRTTAGGAILYAAFSALGAIWLVAATLMSEAVTVDLPVATFWPSLKPSVQITDGPSAHVEAGGFDTAHVSVTGLDLGTRFWLAGGHALTGLTFALIGVVVAILCLRLLRGRPFDRTLSAAMFVTAMTVAVGGLAWQICFAVGESSASQQVLAITGWSINEADVPGGISEIGLPAPALSSYVDFWPIFVGVALAAVGIAFRYGGQLQREKERVLQSNARLRRDTEGLV